MTTIDQLREQLKRDTVPDDTPALLCSRCGEFAFNGEKCLDCEADARDIVWRSIQPDRDLQCDIVGCDLEACWSATFEDYLKRWSCQEHAKNRLHTEWRKIGDWIEVEAAMNGYCQELACSGGELATRKKNNLLVCKWCADLIDEAEAEGDG